MHNSTSASNSVLNPEDSQFFGTYSSESEEIPDFDYYSVDNLVGLRLDDLQSY